MNSTVVRVRNVSNERCKIQSCRYYKGLQKVKWDCIGITEKLLGLQGASQKKGHKVVWDSKGILLEF